MDLDEGYDAVLLFVDKGSMSTAIDDLAVQLERLPSRLAVADILGIYRHNAIGLYFEYDVGVALRVELRDLLLKYVPAASDVIFEAWPKDQPLPRSAHG